MNPQQTNHTRLALVCITILGALAITVGGWLLWKGFAGGGELIITGNTAVSGIIGFLSASRLQQQQHQPTDEPSPPIAPALPPVA